MLELFSCIFTCFYCNELNNSNFTKIDEISSIKNNFKFNLQNKQEFNMLKLKKNFISKMNYKAKRAIPSESQYKKQETSPSNVYTLESINLLEDYKFHNSDYAKKLKGYIDRFLPNLSTLTYSDILYADEDKMNELNRLITMLRLKLKLSTLLKEKISLENVINAISLQIADSDEIERNLLENIKRQCGIIHKKHFNQY